VIELGKLLIEADFMAQLDLIAHSPLTRAQKTCYGALDLDGIAPVVSLDCLKEVTPRETVVRGRRPVQERISALQEWIEAQEADTIALVGHSEYFKVMLDLTKRFKNCDVWKASYGQKKWTDLQLEFRLDEFKE
jgi:phosphohistidine phosphatase SixA